MINLIKKLNNHFYRKLAKELIYGDKQLTKEMKKDIVLKAFLIQEIRNSMNTINVEPIINIYLKLHLHILDVSTDIDFRDIFSSARDRFISVLENTDILTRTQRDDILFKIFRDECFGRRDDTLVTYSRKTYFIKEYLMNKNYSLKMKANMIRIFDELNYKFSEDFGSMIIQKASDKKLHQEIKDNINIIENLKK